MTGRQHYVSAPSRRMFLCLGGMVLDIRGNRPLIHPDTDGFYDDFIASGPPRGRRVVPVRVTTAPWRGKPMRAGAFVAGESWVSWRTGKATIFRSPPQTTREPFWTALLRELPARLTVYAGRGPKTAGTAGKTISNPVRYPLDFVVLMHLLARRNGLIVHGCGAIHRGRGLLFLGRSGAGKTTLARMLAAHPGVRVLSDDRLIIRKNGRGFRMYGTPWAGNGGFASGSSARLSGIYFLNKSRANRLCRLRSGEALNQLLPVASIPWHNSALTVPELSFCESLIGNVPVWRFGFARRTAADFILRAGG